MSPLLWEVTAYFGTRVRLCVLDMDDLRTKIVTEAHGFRYSIHPGSTKMYHDLKEI